LKVLLKYDAVIQYINKNTEIINKFIDDKNTDILDYLQSKCVNINSKTKKWKYTINLCSH